MLAVRDCDRYLVRIQETEFLSMSYSARTHEEAFNLALGAHHGGDPDCVEIIDRRTSRVIVDSATVELGYAYNCARLGITVWRYNVSADYDQASREFVFRATQTH